jgi:coenzyme F420-dependent glucose-6-phosphate dehydrogenase
MAARFRDTKEDAMIEIGYALSSEEHGPSHLVRNAVRAEEAGFSFALISDHFHPWTTRQGQSPFVWSVLGAIAASTRRIRVGTGVTCPLIRMHPAIVAQAAATTAAMMPGRFFLGVGTGENLNEHVTGARWPSASERLEMLEEAIAVIRRLWAGEEVEHHGRHFDVIDARLFTAPPERIQLHVAASGSQAAELAGRLGDGLIATSPNADVVSAFRAAGGRGPRIAQMSVCWAATESEGRRVALEWWPTAAIGGNLSQELPRPQEFEAAAQLVTAGDVSEVVVCGPDPDRHLVAIREYEEAGFDRVYVHQVGPDQEGFIRFYRQQILPNLGAAAAA